METFRGDDQFDPVERFRESVAFDSEFVAATEADPNLFGSAEVPGLGGQAPSVITAGRRRG